MVSSELQTEHKLDQPPACSSVSNASGQHDPRPAAVMAWVLLVKLGTAFCAFRSWPEITKLQAHSNTEPDSLGLGLAP